MRQTIIQEGVQDRLSNLLGDGGTSDYSLQQSMIDDMQRIHYSILGNSQYGRVMAGMNVSLDKNNVQVDSGYGVTIGGNLIKLGAQYVSDGTVEQTDGKIYHVYVNYATDLRSDSEGGHAANVLNALTPQNIIKDQIGANGETLSTAEAAALITIEDGASSSINVSATKLYVMTITFSTVDSSVVPFFTRENDNEGVSYTYSKDVKATIWSTATTYVGNRTDSIVALDSGRNRLKELNVIRLNKSTTATRTASTTDYYVRLTVEGLKANGLVAQVFTSDLELQDMNVDFDITRFTIEDIILDTVVVLRVSTGITSTETTTSFFDQDYDTPATISYVIERLT